MVTLLFVLACVSVFVCVRERAVSEHVLEPLTAAALVFIVFCVQADDVSGPLRPGQLTHKYHEATPVMHSRRVIPGTLGV